MKLLRPRTRYALVAVVLCCGSIGSLLTYAADEAGFTPLFNGKDLSGWVTPADKSLFTVEDGEIVGRTKTKDDLQKNEFLVTSEPYGDFILKLKFKFLAGNSGVQVRSDRAENGKVSGPQADIGEGYFGSLYEENRRGMLDAYPKDKGESLFRKGEWNEMTVAASGDHLSITLNGTKTVDRVDPKLSKSGIIALQVHAGRVNDVHFKDIMIRAN